MTKGGQATFKFTFLDVHTGNELTMLGFPFTIFDLDGYGGEFERVKVSGYDTYELAPDSYVKEENDVFKATKFGSGKDNPKDPYDLSDFQKRTSVGFSFKQTSSFKVTLQWDKGGKKGRNYLFSFGSKMTEVTTTLPPTTTTVATTTAAATTKAPEELGPPPEELGPPPEIEEIGDGPELEIGPPPKKKKSPPPPAVPTTTIPPITTLAPITITTTPLGPGRPAGCYAKLEDFEGTNLNPNTASAKIGRNKLALKEANRADRCYK